MSVPAIWSKFVVRLRAVLARRHAETELDEELQYHLDREIERGVASGMSPADARLAARRAFGNVAQHKAAVRDSWGVAAAWADEAKQNLRFALRNFRHSPAFVGTVVLTIALGLGLNTSAFTVFNAYVLRPLAVRDAGSLYEVTFRDAHNRIQHLSWRQYRDLRGIPIAAETFAHAFVIARSDRGLLIGQAITGDGFRVLGARPGLGRLLLPEDAAPPIGENVVVLSHDAWRTKFGGDSAIVGKVATLHGLSFRVVGVAEGRFTGIGPVPPDFWAPVTAFSRIQGTPDLLGSSEPQVLRAVLRLKPGVDEQRARAQLGAWALASTSNLPDSLRWTRVDLMSVASALPLTPETVAEFAPAALAFLLVLLIACANVANVMLARGIARQREIGIRLALGAGRSRVIRQLLTESLLLAIPAAVLGFLISQWTLEASVRVMYASAPAGYAAYLRVMPLSPDLRVFGFVSLAALVSAVAFGLLPALQTTRPNIVQAARGDFDTAFRPGRIRGALVVAQICGSTLLLIVTGILLRGASKAQRLEIGLRTRDVVELTLDDRGRRAALERLRAEPTVVALGASRTPPLDGYYPTIAMHGAGDRRVTVSSYVFADARFFTVLDVPIRRGRAFSDAEERGTQPVVVVNEAAAQLLWPNTMPIGQLVQLGADPPRGSALARVRTARVIGVANNTVNGWIGTGIGHPIVYYPASADSADARILARVVGDANSARDRLDDEITRLNPSAINELHTLDDYVALQRWPFRIFSWLASALGAIALALTLIGVYGVLSYLVAQRTREIGIRMALGASALGVVAHVVRQSLHYAVIGGLAGMALALAVSRVFASELVIVSTFDPAGYGAGLAIILAACVAASLAPSRRAARVNPVEALRRD
ncbi:MAG TPA: ADOP family duplicated permease [Gemmatimonadales bacterium]|jgi:putative ABC transport system permease protein|nr:ADOP family duplicated permease [Gemmatimonadales bacterium]